MQVIETAAKTPATFSLLSIATGPSDNRLEARCSTPASFAARMGCRVMTLACPKPLSVYRPRDPRDSDLWRLMDQHFETFREVDDERFSGQVQLLATCGGH